ncbi:hypothetical protein K7432_007943 [Basidiobolus ranarum]|uniref:RAD51 interacting motif domain-containing protein n=1 Tax=Basidiobolus ranarum TaxID=34480 RepID=A0ABR2VZD7_9FUNG
MESRRSSRPKKQVDYTINLETGIFHNNKPKSLDNMPDDFDDFRLEGNERKKIVDSVLKETLETNNKESKRPRLSATERKEQADLKKALELSMVEEDCLDKGKVERTFVKDIWADPNFFGNQERQPSRRKERNSSKSGINSDTPSSNKQETSNSSSNTSSQSTGQSNQVTVDSLPLKSMEKSPKQKSKNSTPSSKEIEDLFDDGDLSDSNVIDIVSDDEMALVPEGKRKSKPSGHIAKLESSVPKSNQPENHISESDSKEDLSHGSSSVENKELGTVVPSTTTEINIVIPKVRHNTDLNLDIDVNDAKTTPKRRSPRSARKKQTNTTKSDDANDSEFELNEPNTKRNPKSTPKPIYNLDDVNGESESEFEEKAPKSKRKIKSPSKPKVKKVATPKSRKIDNDADSEIGHPHTDELSMDAEIEERTSDVEDEEYLQGSPNDPKTPKNTRTNKSRTTQLNITPSNNTPSRTPSVGLKVSSSVKPLLLTKPTVQTNSNASARSPVVSGGPARVGLSRKHKFKPLHPYLQSPSKVSQS